MIRWLRPLRRVAPTVLIFVGYLLIVVSITWSFMIHDARRCMAKCIAVQAYPTADRCEWACYEAKGTSK